MISCTKWAQFCISGVYLHFALPGKRKTRILREFCHAQKCHGKYLSVWAAPMKAIPHGRCQQGWIKGYVTFPAFGMLGGKLIHRLSGHFSTSIAFWFITFHMEKDWQIFLAIGIQIVFWKNHYQTQPELQPNIPILFHFNPWYMLSCRKEAWKKIFFFPYQLLISKLGVCSFGLWFWFFFYLL